MAENYVLKVKIDDSDLKKLEKRIAGLITGKSVSSSGGAGNQNELMKNLAKLGLIATGVTGLLAVANKIKTLLVDSSPMLQQMLKLLNFSIMLIFRPIGDFIGFILRPVIIFFLRRFIIPWYKDVYPVMKNLGTKIGGALEAVLDLFFPKGEDSIVTWTKLTALLAGGLVLSKVSLDKAKKTIVSRFPAAGEILGRNAGNVFNTKTTGEKSAVNKLKNLKPTGLNSAANKLISAFRMLNRITFPTIPKPAWLTSFDTTVNKLVNLFTKTPTTAKAPTTKGTVKSGTGLKGHGGGWVLKDLYEKQKGLKNTGSKLKGGGTKIGKGLNWMLAYDMLVSPGDLGGWLPQTGAPGDPGYVDLNAGNPLDFIPTSHEIINGIIEGVGGLFNQPKNNVVININQMDKTGVDYLNASLQSGLNK